MDHKKIIEIEERIPTLKERRKQRANRRLIVYISMFFFINDDRCLLSNFL
ncbi:MAG: hypothetical protein LRY73_07065 [Bacillus sp. (in: Bacteria)]|nr:hypothetical protein [Bacillus sp. (in: firmicutes)]